MTIEILEKKYTSCKKKLEAMQNYSNFAIKDIQGENQDLLEFLDTNKSKI